MKEDSQVINTIKKVIPSVVSIIISKYLTVYENPLGQDYFGSEFNQSFPGQGAKKKIKVGGGSGFIVDKSGIILTNRHVVIDPQAEYMVVLNDERKFKAEILARDPINDVAIIKINDKNNFPTLELGDSSNLELGQTVIAIGNTLGAFQNTVSVGVVSGLSRKIKAFDVFDKQTQSLRGLIQTDAAINPGNSGGPLADIEGKAIGINCAVVFGAENVGFTIPISLAKKDLDDLKKYGKIRQPFLGVRYVPLNKKLQQEYNFPADHGALVISDGIPGREAIITGGPAEKAGIKETDIILEVQNKKITSENTLEEILQDFKVGEEIALRVLRRGKEILLKAILDEKK
jgi:serine protease Do